MARIKIDYGIDLGTTNSAICRMEKGEPKIIKTDTLMDTLPSCVGFTRNRGVNVGVPGLNLRKKEIEKAMRTGTLDKNAFIEFKRTLATSTLYPSSNMGRSFSSIELSSEVLKTLKSFVTDENFTSVVITVPAKFHAGQKCETIQAANLAGFSKCELLPEPVAASMAYGLTADSKNGIWMVFDFGGGTFDAALLKVEDGIMQVFDTEGDNYLGGKDLDYAIVDNILIKYLQDNFSVDSYLENEQTKSYWREMLKTEAEKAKNQLSFKPTAKIEVDEGDMGEDDNEEEISINLSLTQEQVFDVMRPYFQKAVDICKNLLKRNNLSGNQLNKLILVGGPTHSPLIRQMLREQITPNVDTSIDPMTAVATGAALYASTIDADVTEKDVEVGTVMLEVGYESTSVETTEWVSVKLGAGCKLPKVWVELMRSDKAWSSGKVEIDSIGNVIEANLLESKPNSFSVVAYDEKGNSLPCFPEEITIIQGAKVGAAPLPYNIGIARWDDIKKRGVFKMAIGLEKNKPVPATGVINDLRTTAQLRPGVESDCLRIPVYQVDDFYEAEGKTASLYEYVGDVEITGDDVDCVIPEDSLVDITLKVDSSEQMTFEVHFLSSDITVEKSLVIKQQSIEDAEKEINKALPEVRRTIMRMSGGGVSTEALQAELEKVSEEAKNSSEKKAVLQHLKELLRKIENLESATEWERLEKELREEFERLERAQNDLGNDKTAQLVNQLRTQTDSVIRSKDVKLGHEVLDQINSLFVQLTMLYQCMALIRHYNERFGSVRWKDAGRARQLINQGLTEMNNQPTTERIRPIACGIIELLPPDEADNAGGMLR